MPESYEEVQKVISLLEERGVKYELRYHPAAYTVEDVDAFQLPNSEWGAKNLFLRDDKKRSYFLLVALDHRHIDIKDFQRRIGSRRLSFASPEDLNAILHLYPGAVTPFGVLNDEEKKVQVFIDDSFAHHPIWVHPNDNRASVYLSADALKQVLEEQGSTVHYISLD